MSYLPLKAAKKSGIPVRIAHSHNTSIDKDFKYPLKQYFRHRIPSVATDYCACGKEAGKFLFGDKDFTFIPNAIEIQNFTFNEKVRVNKRNELGIHDEYVIGHVGRLSYQKNHKFLIRIFSAFVNQYPNSILLLIGVGEKEEEIKNQVKELGLENKVKFLGSRSDVNELYQAMDVFVMPSLFEGVPVVGIEAQFSDLPCVFSTRVPSEVRFNSKTKFIDLDASIDQWVEEIIKTKNQARKSDSEELKNSIYDIKRAKNILEDYYLSFGYME